jgi:hypothetical protein
MFTSMPFVQKYVPYDKYTERDLLLDDHIQLVPLIAREEALLGTAIAGGLLDEVNFMDVIEQSKLVAGQTGLGGRYDQAEIIYHGITSRINSRFVTQGANMGMLCVSSSVRYEGDFLERLRAKATKNNDPDTLVYWKKRYDVQPPSRYSGQTFPLLLGNTYNPTKVITQEDYDNGKYDSSQEVVMVPIEYWSDFDNDPENAVRDIIGMSTNTICPFLTQRNKIVDAIVAGKEEGMLNWVDKDEYILGKEDLPYINDSNLPSDLTSPRFVHVDLARSSDRVGITVVRVLPHKAVTLRTGDDNAEMLPCFAVECCFGIKPSIEYKIDIPEIRKWINNLKIFYGVNIVSVTYDGFDSAESVQLWRKGGISSDTISMDRTSEPYKYLRTALYQNRIKMINNELLRMELANLEYHADKDKIDHPVKFSKDLSDSMCGAIFAASQSRRVRKETLIQGMRDRGGRRLSANRRSISARRR